MDRRWLLALLAGAWPLANSSMAGADPRGDAFLKEVQAATRATRTLTADVLITTEGEGQTVSFTGTVKLKKPNRAGVELTGGLLNETNISDGRTIWRLMKAQNEYTRGPADPQHLADLLFPNLPAIFFFDPQFTQLASFFGGKIKPHVGRPVTIDGMRYTLLEAVVQVNSSNFKEKPPDTTLRWYVAPDRRIYRAGMIFKQGPKMSRAEMLLKNVRVNQPLPDAVFAFRPPRTATLVDRSSPDAGLLPLGKTAPDFTLPTPSGGEIALREALKGKKALLVNFWFYY
jgi:outer membrane lipoprotein-sorting protein